MNTKETHSHYFEFDEVKGWVANETVAMLKVVSPLTSNGDPVELTADELRQLASMLLELAKIIE